jgi:O-antigen ligase
MRRYRALSLVALITLILSITAYIAIGSAQALHSRGTVQPFPQPVFGAEELRLGVNAALEQYDDQALNARLSELAERSIRAIRQEFRWSALEPARGRFDWAISDRIMQAAARHGIAILPVLWTTPEWARAPSASTRFPPTETAPPADPEDFARFAGAFAQRYGHLKTADGQKLLLGYQIWDEPNLSAAWGNALVDPTYYLQLLRAARAAIRAVDPDARIVLAGLAPTIEQSNVNLAPQLFLLKLYQLGGHEAFEIAAAKAYGFDFPPDDRRVDAGVLNFSHAILLREMMVAHNDGHKAIWITQFGWNALPAGWRGEPSIWGNVSEAQQAEYVVRAVARAAREWPWAGAMFLEALQPRPRPQRPEADAQWGFALIGQDGEPRPAYRALAQAVPIAAQAPRAQLFANCRYAQSLYRTLNLENVMTAMPEILAAKPDCTTPNPRATFSPGWRFGQLGADIPDRPDARATFSFTGDALALIVRRANYRAYTFVEIDGQPANLLPREPRGAYLIMTSPGLYPVIETIAVADGLGQGQHTATVTVDRGWNQWSLIGWSSKQTDNTPWELLRGLAILMSGLSVAGLLVSVHRSRWRAWWRVQLVRINDPLDPWRITIWRARAALAAALLWITAALTWAQDAATAYRALGLGPQVVLSGLASGVLFWSPATTISLLALVALGLMIFLRLELGLMLVAFFVPFYLLPQRLFERSFAMVELLLLLCVVSWAARWAWRLRGVPLRALRPRLTLLDWSVLGLTVIALFSALQADFRVEAFREWRLVIVEPALLYVMLRTLPALQRDRACELSPLLSAFLLGAATVAGIGLVNYVRGDVIAAEFGLPRIKSVFGSPNNDALFLERALPLLIAGAVLGTGHGVRRLAYLLAVIPVGMALLLTQSRGALLLGLPAMVITMALLAGRRWRWLGIALLVITVLGFLALFSGLAQEALAGTRLAGALDLQRGTGFFRLNLWQSALTMWRDHPWLGVGPDNFLYAYRSFYILPVAWQEPNLSHPHNIVLDFATRLGGLGVLIGGGMILGYVAQIKRALRHDRALAVGCAGLLAAMLGHGLVDHSFFLIELAYPFMLTAGLLSAMGSRERGAELVYG